MELHKRVLPPEILLPELLSLLDEADSVPLEVSGGSMTPFLAGGRDTVFLSKVTKTPKRGDVLLYQRRSGQYVLHRVYRVEDGCFTMLGDAQTQTEPGICPNQLRAIVTAVRRKGRLVKKGSPCWLFFETIWLWLVPLRHKIMAVHGALTGKRRRGK